MSLYIRKTPQQLLFLCSSHTSSDSSVPIPPHPQPQNESASMLTKRIIRSILCYNDAINKQLLKLINYYMEESQGGGGVLCIFS